MSDNSEVKSVVKFLMNVKTMFDITNTKLPEDATKIDFDQFETDFYKANEGLQKNRDQLKTEKLKLVDEADANKTTMDELTKKYSSIDENLPDKYNKAIDELSGLKASIKDGAVDIDLINNKHQSEIELLTTTMEKAKTDELAVKDTELNSFRTSSDTFKGLYTKTLRKEGLMNELERINVNPEDRPLIMRAYLGRAEVSNEGEDKDKFDVFYKNDKGDLQSGTEFWDKWATDGHNQKYVLADENKGGGANPNKNPVAVNPNDKNLKTLNEESDTLSLQDKMTLMENMSPAKK